MTEAFSCPNCSTQIVTDDPDAVESVDCPGCGNRYWLEFDDFEDEYYLQPQEPPQIPVNPDTDRL